MQDAEIRYDQLVRSNALLSYEASLSMGWVAWLVDCLDQDMWWMLNRAGSESTRRDQ